MLVNRTFMKHGIDDIYQGTLPCNCKDTHFLKTMALILQITHRFSTLH